MKKAIYILLISLIVSVLALNNTLIVVAYYLNKTYIAQTYCENKDKPNLHCQGKCYLKKQLKQAESEPSSETVSMKYIEIVYILPKNTTTVKPTITTSEQVHYQPLIMASSAHLQDIFHPPIV